MANYHPVAPYLVETSPETDRIFKIVEFVFGQSAAILGDARFRLLLLAELVIVLGTSLVSPILNTLAGVYGVSPASIGLLVTAVTAPAVVIIPIAGSLADYYSRRVVLITGLTLFGCGGVALAFTTSFPVALALRVIQGIGFAFTLPTLITTIRDIYSGQSEVTGQGLRNAAGGVGNMIFPGVGGVVVIVAWYLPFLLYGLALPVAIAVYLWFEEPTDTATNTGPGVAGGRSEPTPEIIDKVGYMKQIFEIITRRHVAAILVARTLFSVVVFAFLTYNSLVVSHVFNGSPALAALFVALWAGIYSIISSQTGRITGRWGYTAPLVFLNVALGVGLILVAIGPTIHVAGLGIVSIGFGVGIGGALYRSIVSGFAPQELRAGVVSVGELLGRLGASSTPLILGIFISQLEPNLGIGSALQWTIGGTGVVTIILGISCIAIYSLSAPGEGGFPSMT